MAEPLNATFFAFKKRERKGVLTGITLAYLGVMIVILGAFLAINYQAVGSFVSWYGQVLQNAANAAKGGAADPSLFEPPAGLVTFFLTLIPFIFVGYVAFAAFEAACLRWMVRGETGGFMGLSLGRDTWTVYLTYWIWFFLYMGYSIVSGIVAAVVTGLALFAMRDSGNYMLSLAITQLAQLVTYIPMIYFAVRLAPAAAVSIGENRVAFFDAWKVTKGRFWPLFGSFFLLYLIVLAGEVVVGGAIIALFFASLWPALQNIGADPSGQQLMDMFAALFTPQNQAILAGAYLVILALSLLVYILFYGVNARAVVAAADEGKIQGVQTAAVATTFD